MYERHTLPVITRSYAATCRSPAGENGRHFGSGFAGEPASPVGDSSALPVTDRRVRSAGFDLCPAVGTAYGRQSALPLLLSLAAGFFFQFGSFGCRSRNCRNFGRRMIGGYHKCVAAVLSNWPHSLYMPGA
jgi:hypothetical protein